MNDHRVGFALWFVIVIGGWLLLYLLLRICDWHYRREARRNAEGNRQA